MSFTNCKDVNILILLHLDVITLQCIYVTCKTHCDYLDMLFWKSKFLHDDMMFNDV
jgi:hypothetical protein